MEWAACGRLRSRRSRLGKEESAFLFDLRVHTAHDDEDDPSSLMVEDPKASAAADSTGRDTVHNLVATVEAATGEPTTSIAETPGPESRSGDQQRRSCRCRKERRGRDREGHTAAEGNRPEPVAGQHH